MWQQAGVDNDRLDYAELQALMYIYISGAKVHQAKRGLRFLSARNSDSQLDSDCLTGSFEGFCHIGRLLRKFVSRATAAIKTLLVEFRWSRPKYPYGEPPTANLHRARENTVWKEQNSGEKAR